MLVDDFKLENWINEREKFARYDLSNTCVEALTINELERLCDCSIDLKNIKLNYGQLFGSDGLKSAICNLYENQNPENVTVTLGGIGANNLVLQTLINKGDKVVCVLPCYQQAYSLPKFFGANVEFFFLNQNDWSIDKERFANMVGTDTKVICLTNPNNPTGKVLSDEDFKFIIQVARNSDAYIFADEVYRGLNHNGEAYSKSFVDIYEKSVVTGSMSKAYSLAGIRLGWVVASQEVIKDINLNREYNTISISALDDFVATVALNNHEKLIQRNLKIIKQGKQIVNDFINSEEKFFWIEPNSATVGCINYEFDLKSKEFCNKLFEDTKLLVIPAFVFEQENYFRIGYAMNPDYLQQALNSLSDWFRKIY